jgi:hypothetical protein
MNKRTKKSQQTSGAPCLCMGAGPALSDLLRRLGPPEQARRHFETARLEMLKGLRAILDARIEQVSKRSRKGEKIEVE